MESLGCVRGVRHRGQKRGGGWALQEAPLTGKMPRAEGGGVLVGWRPQDGDLPPALGAMLRPDHHGAILLHEGGALPVHVGGWALANRGGLGVLPAPCGHPVCRRAVVGDAAALGLVGAAAPSADPLRRRRRGVGLPPGSYPARGGAVAVRDGARGSVNPTALGAQTGAARWLGSRTAPKSTLGAPASSAHDSPPSPAYLRNAWRERHNPNSYYMIWWISNYIHSNGC